ncbi:MAG: glycosyltransferase [Ignavibacteriales bacterium]|nr:MAG: glycosyltransferase [Ignavibacteriaceae bacterium]MBW7873943.1 glycosyltransferase [Ignavibacteria bacterium]MCZ2143298.1 glycosyltransferase [Ignavibacteriales bacterium]OQY76332.1 MAG: glycosyl transferase [Ignavibacteriales bacterium UTCHB3]MBV6444180.1 hypothetical protein [Ignavibacteriaceae bacterium]
MLKNEFSTEGGDQTPVLSIIIVNYNVKEFIQNLLESIKSASKGITTEVIIVDNASDDGSIELIQQKYPWVKLLVNSRNLGFGKANNIGLRQATGRYILLLNPDTLVKEDTFEKMIAFFEATPDAGMAGCKLLNTDGSLQLACRRGFPGPWASFTKIMGLSALFPKSRWFAKYNLTYLDENQTYAVDAISGAFMMMTREAFEKTGEFDETFFMYGEDLDLCYRINKAGYKVYYVHTTEIIHYKGESTKRSDLNEVKVFYEAMHIFVKKYYSGSWLLSLFLRSAIFFRELIAFMGKRKLVFLAVLVDIIFYNLTMLFAVEMYQRYRMPNWEIPQYGLPVIYTVPVLVHILTSVVLTVYRKDRLSVLRTIGAVIAGFFVITSLTFFFKDYAFSRGVVLILYFSLPVTLAGWRVVAKLWFKAGVTGGVSFRKKAAIVGTGEEAVRLAQKLQKKKGGSRIAGLIGLKRSQTGERIEGFEVIGSVDHIIRVIRERGIEEVIFTTGELSYNAIIGIVAACRKENVEFQITGGESDFMVSKSEVSLLNEIQLFEVNYNIGLPLHKVIKKTFDFLFALFILIFLFPFLFAGRVISGRKSRFYEFISKFPQVLRGKVSIVGPKQEAAPGEPWLGKRGLTGFWFTDIDEDENSSKPDIFYAKNQNIWLDLEIIGRTFNKLMNDS